METQRSKDPKIMSIVNQIRQDNKDIPAIDTLMEIVTQRLDKGQQEHHSDYLTKHIPDEVSEEFLDFCFGWPIMQAYKSHKYVPLVREWAKKMIHILNDLEDFDKRVKEIEKEDMPRVMLTVAERIEEDLPERS